MGKKNKGQTMKTGGLNTAYLHRRRYRRKAPNGLSMMQLERPFPLLVQSRVLCWSAL